MRKTKPDEVPEVPDLQRIHAIALQCKSAAFELAKFAQATQLKVIASWMHIVNKGFSTGNYSEQRKLLISIVDALLSIASADLRGIKFEPPLD